MTNWDKCVCIFAFFLILYILNMYFTVSDKPKKPVFILYYTDWCHHCKQYMPIWNDLKNKYSNKYIFIEYNYDLLDDNNIVKSQINGFPTVHYKKNIDCDVYKTVNNISDPVKSIN